MLKLAVLVIAALAVGPCIVQAQYETNYIAGDPHIWSHYGGDQTCSFSSAAWLQTFQSPRINIESVFSDFVVGQQHPTVQTSFRITFTNPGTSPLQTETFTAVDANLGFPSTFISGASTTGWVDILVANSNTFTIIDYTTGALIYGFAYSGIFDLYVYAPSWFFESGRGLLVQGCPYKDIFDYSTNSFLSYNPNQNWGRKKRQVDDKRIRLVADNFNPECDEIAKVFASTFPESKAFNAETVARICRIDAAFVKNAAGELKNKIETIQQANEFQKEKIGDKVPPAYYDNPRVQDKN